MKATASNLARAERPDDLVAVALQHHLRGETDEMRAADLDNVCSVTASMVREATQRMAASLPHARTVILGPKHKLCLALKNRPDAFELQPD